jgi:cysteine synthase A
MGLSLKVNSVSRYRGRQADCGLGIGQGRVTNNLKGDLSLLDGAIHVPDSKSIAMVYRLLDEEGLYVGASSALNVVAAMELAKKKGKGSTVVTILCDGAYRYVLLLMFEMAQADVVYPRYQNRLFSRVWLESKGLVQHIPENLQKQYIVLP